MAEPMTTPTRPRTPVDPNVGIPDLMHRLRDDAGRLARDEVRLAKLEIKETLETGAHGLLWLVIGFGVAAITLVAWTIFVATLIAALVWEDSVTVSPIRTPASAANRSSIAIVRGAGRGGRESMTWMNAASSSACIRLS